MSASLPSEEQTDPAKAVRRPGIPGETPQQIAESIRRRRLRLPDVERLLELTDSEYLYITRTKTV